MTDVIENQNQKATEQKPKVNLFAGATKRTVSAKAEKRVITVANLGKDIEACLAYRAAMKEMEGTLAQTEGHIKEIGKREFMRVYQLEKCNIGSFNLESEGKKVTIVPMDKYPVIKERSIAEAMGDLVEEVPTFTINKDLVEKYGQVLSDLIMNSPDIADADKAQLIEGTVEFRIKKGTIDRLASFPNPEQVFQAINPQFQIRTQASK